MKFLIMHFFNPYDWHLNNELEEIDLVLF